MKDKVEQALNDIRPSLQVDGGDVELVDVENGIVGLSGVLAIRGNPYTCGIRHHVQYRSTC